MHYVHDLFSCASSFLARFGVGCRGDGGRLRDRTFALNAAQAAAFWGLRDGLIEIQARRGRHLRADTTFNWGPPAIYKNCHLKNQENYVSDHGRPNALAVLSPLADALDAIGQRARLNPQGASVRSSSGTSFPYDFRTEASWAARFPRKSLISLALPRGLEPLFSPGDNLDNRSCPGTERSPHNA
jgi:hypothetical protein